MKSTYETENEIRFAEKAIRLLQKNKPSLMYDAGAAIKRYSDGKVEIDDELTINKLAAFRLINIVDNYVNKKIKEVN